MSNQQNDIYYENLMEGKTEQYQCQSYFDNNNVLKDCTCGKCFSCIRCNNNGCPACDVKSRGSIYNPEPY